MSRECEICGTTLPRGRNPIKSAPASRPGSDDEEDDGGSDYDDQGPRFMKVSFRKGGDKPFYAVLRRSLLSKGWEVRVCGSFSPLDRRKTIFAICAFEFGSTLHMDTLVLPLHSSRRPALGSATKAQRLNRAGLSPPQVVRGLVCFSDPSVGLISDSYMRR